MFDTPVAETLPRLTKIVPLYVAETLSASNESNTGSEYSPVFPIPN